MSTSGDMQRRFRAFEDEARRVGVAIAQQLGEPSVGTLIWEAVRVLCDPDLCSAVRAAWALGGIEAAAGVVKHEAYPTAQGGDA